MSNLIKKAFLLKLVFMTSALIVSVIPAHAQEYAEISFTEVSHDFGSVREGRIVEKIFTYTNTGNTPLLLSGVRTTCGCTALEWPKTPLKPNATAQIKVSFDTKGKIGKQNKSVTVLSNGLTPSVRLALMGMVLPDE